MPECSVLHEQIKFARIHAGLALLFACCSVFPLWQCCPLSARLMLSCVERHAAGAANVLPGVSVVCASVAQLPGNHMLQVRVAYFREGEPQPETSKLAQHSGRAHKLALIPEQPTCFYRQVAGLTS